MRNLLKIIFFLDCSHQVVFKNFYSTSSAADKCTLFSDRNLINRRNVKADVDAAVNPCRKFFELEVKARLMAAAMQVLGMENLEDTPRGEFFCPNLRDAGNVEEKDYLRKIASSVIDNFVLRREKVEALLERLLSAEREEAENRREQTEDGRFICKFPGCEKTFAHNGKLLRDHEATHNAPVIVSASDSQTLETTTSPGKTKERDDMFNYQCSFLEYGMIILNFFDAIKEGDGERILRCWKFQPYLKKDLGTKYALEALGLMFQVYGLLSPKAAHELIWNRSALLSGHNIPLDLLLEFFNRLLKEVVRKLGPNATNHKAVDRYCHAVDITKAALDNFDRECTVARRSGHHYEISVMSDLHRVVTELCAYKAFNWTAGRTYGHFEHIDSSLLDGFNLSEMFGWINEHKQEIIRARRAR